jgi:hypothetical protein
LSRVQGGSFTINRIVVIDQVCLNIRIGIHVATKGCVKCACFTYTTVYSSLVNQVIKNFVFVNFNLVGVCTLFFPCTKSRRETRQKWVMGPSKLVFFGHLWTGRFHSYRRTP